VKDPRHLKIKSALKVHKLKTKCVMGKNLDIWVLAS
jgi:hypothetical protein